MKRTVVVIDRGVYYYCREAIGGNHYYPIARLEHRDRAKELTSAAPDGMIIVRFSDRRWAVTMKGADEDNIKSIRATCTNQMNAGEMIKETWRGH